MSTFGSQIVPGLIMDLPNYLLTHNGDGINDFLKIDELDRSPNNHLRIYDRNGLLVFDKENYINEFNGYATEGHVVFQRGRGLPSGVYFYLVRLHDLNLEYQGFLYLVNNRLNRARVAYLPKSFWFFEKCSHLMVTL